MDNILKFEGGICLYSNQLKTEILAVIQSINKNAPLEKEQINFVKNIFENLYQYDQVKIKKIRGRGKGKINHNLSLIVYLIIKSVDGCGNSLTASLNAASMEYSIGIKTLERAYYELEKEIRENLKNNKSYQLTMDYGVQVYLKK